MNRKCSPPIGVTRKQKSKMKVLFTSQKIDKVETEIIVMTCYQDDVPLRGWLGLLDWRINGRLSHIIKDQNYTGAPRELLLMPGEHRFEADQVLILGLGAKNEFSLEYVEQVIKYFVEVIEKKRSERVCFSLNQLLPSHFEWRNAIRILLTYLASCEHLKELILCEPLELVRDAKRRQISFGPQIEVDYL